MRDALKSAKPDNRETALKRRREFAAEMRAKGFKRVVRWVPDPANPTFAVQFKRDMEALGEFQRTHGAVDFLPPEEDLPGWS
jgi:hypothetical protein